MKPNSRLTVCHPSLVTTRVAMLSLIVFCNLSAAGAEPSITDLGSGTAYDITSSGKIAAFIDGQPVVTDGATQQIVSWSGFWPPVPAAINDAGDVLLNGPVPTGC